MIRITGSMQQILLKKDITEDDKNYLLYLVKISCRRETQNAIHRGELVKPEECYWCGSKASELEGHHPNYFFPLDIVWLCRRCHAKIHSPLTRMGNEFRKYNNEFDETAQAIAKLILPEAQLAKQSIFISEQLLKKKPKSYITGSAENDAVYKWAKVRHCGRSCCKIYTEAFNLGPTKVERDYEEYRKSGKFFLMTFSEWKDSRLKQC